MGAAPHASTPKGALSAGRPPLKPGGRGAQANGDAGLCTQDQLLIRRVTSENEGLFREKWKTLEQLHSLEEAKQSDGQALCALQNRWEMPGGGGIGREFGGEPHPKPPFSLSLFPRVQLLEGENKQLQDRTLQLSLQVGILERALRTIHVHSLEVSWPGPRLPPVSSAGALAEPPLTGPQWDAHLRR